MNKIEAIIRPEKLTSVKDALADAGLVGINVVHVIGRGSQKTVMSGSPRGTERYLADMVPKVKLELVVCDADTQEAIDIIIATSRTGNIGDGKVFITPVAKAIRIRTGEQDDQSIKVLTEVDPYVWTVNGDIKSGAHL